MSIRLQLILIVISILLDMAISLPFPLYHPSLLLIYRYIFVHVSAEIGFKVSWDENLCVIAFLTISGISIAVATLFHVSWA